MAYTPVKSALAQYGECGSDSRLYLQLKPARVRNTVAPVTLPMKNVLNMSTAKTICPIAHNIVRSSQGKGIVGVSLSSQLAPEPLAFLHPLALPPVAPPRLSPASLILLFLIPKPAELRPMLFVAEEPAATLTTKKGRMTLQLKLKRECRNIARLPARVPGSDFEGSWCVARRASLLMPSVRGRGIVES